MHNIGVDEPLQKWFDHKVPKTKVPADFIEKALTEPELNAFKPEAKIIFLGNAPAAEYSTQSKKGNTREIATLTFTNKRSTQQIQVLKTQAEWFISMLAYLSANTASPATLRYVKESYENAGLEDFEIFWDNKPVNTLFQSGLLTV